MADKKGNTSFAILGLGRFGMSIVKTLSEYDVDILACDIDEATLHSSMAVSYTHLGITFRRKVIHNTHLTHHPYQNGYRHCWLLSICCHSNTTCCLRRTHQLR